MIANILRNVALAAGFSILSGCVVTQAQLNAQLNQRMSEMHAYTDQRVATFDEKIAQTDQKFAAREAELYNHLEEVKAASAAVMRAVESQEQAIQRNSESVRAMLEARSQALGNEKLAVDALLNRVKPPAAGTAPSAVAPAPPASPPPTKIY